MPQLGNTQFLHRTTRWLITPINCGKKATLPKYRVTLSLTHTYACLCARHKDPSLWSLFALCACVKFHLSLSLCILCTNFADFIVCGKNISRPRVVLLSQFGWDNNWPLVRPPQRVYKSNKMQGRVYVIWCASLVKCCGAAPLLWVTFNALTKYTRSLSRSLELRATPECMLLLATGVIKLAPIGPRRFSY